MTSSNLNSLKEYLQRYENLKGQKRKGKDEFVAEFQRIKKESESLLRNGKVTASEGAKELNKKKNRYKDILPFDHSRVILDKVSSREGSDYVNANYIKSPEGRAGYIASQGPLPSTVNDFWRMILQHKVKIVVMACKEIELGKHRCQRYWPLEGEQLMFDRIQVTLEKQISLADNLIERKIRARLGKEDLLLSQIHYTSWPDHGAPKSSSDIIELVEIMRENHPWDDPPVLIHCSAGCGRTGAIVAIDYGRRLIRKAPDQFSVYDIVSKLREQRPAMVQSKEQYEYLYEVFKDLITERIKKSESDTKSRGAYMNIDFGNNENVSIYENFDSSPKPSPKALRKGRPVPVPGGAPTQGIIVRRNLGEPRKPIITSNAKTPQQATIRNDLHYPQLPPKTAAKPTNLMDSSQDSSKDLSLPLEPVSLNTVELRKPTGADKEWTSQNYMNVSVGAPKVPQKPSPNKNKLPIARKISDSQSEKSALSRGASIDQLLEVEAKERPQITKSRSCDAFIDDVKPISPPSLPTKPSNEKKNKDSSTQQETNRPGGSKSNRGLLDGSRPPLPLKNRDLLDFESPTKPNGPSDFSDNIDSSAHKMANDINQLLGETSHHQRKRSDNQNKPLVKSRPDVKPRSHDNNDNLLTNSKLGSPLSPSSVFSGKFDNVENDLFDLSEKSAVKRAELPKEKKPVPIPPAKNLKPSKRTRSDESDMTSRHPVIVQSRVTSQSKNEVSATQNNTARKAMTLPRNGLAGRTNQATDANATKFLVTLQKTEPINEQSTTPCHQSSANGDRPGVTKHASAGAILVGNAKFSSPPNQKTLLQMSANYNKSNMANQNTVSSTNQNDRAGQPRLNAKPEKNGGLDQTDSSALYAVVQKPPARPTEDSVYESIWSPKKSAAPIDDAPPTLPARTPDSFIVLYENHFDEKGSNNNPVKSDSEDGVTPSENSPPSASSDQSSLPWLAVGLDKLRSKWSPAKAAFSSAVKTNRQTPSSSGSSSTFFTQQSNSAGMIGVTSPKTQNLNYGSRLSRKPKGPRPMPKDWPSIKPSSTNR